MLTVTDLVRFLIRQESEHIYNLKQAEIKTATAKKTVWVCKGYPTIEGRVATREEFTLGYRATQVEYKKIVQTISPKSKSWAVYKGAKRQASILLTARRILKVKAGELPGVSLEESTTYALGIIHGSKKPRRMTTKARKYLRKLENRLEKHPERFADAQKWAKEHPVPVKSTLDVIVDGELKVNVNA